MLKSSLLILWLVHIVTVAFASPVDTGPLQARAELAPLAGSTIAGTVDFMQVGGQLHVVARLHGLAPGLHAFHVHQNGDCTSAATTGGNLDPGNGGGARSEHHGGEFGAIDADEEGRAALNMLLESFSLAREGAAGSILGRSIVVHSSPDDFSGSPADTKGKTLACGVIRPA